MSRGKWRVSKRRLAALDAEVAEIVDAQEAIHAAPGQMTNADWDAIADLNRRYARATDARDRMRFTLWRKQREKLHGVNCLTRGRSCALQVETRKRSRRATAHRQHGEDTE